MCVPSPVLSMVLHQPTSRRSGAPLGLLMDRAMHQNALCLACGYSPTLTLNLPWDSRVIASINAPV